MNASYGFLGMYDTADIHQNIKRYPQNKNKNKNRASERERGGGGGGRERKREFSMRSVFTVRRYTANVGYFALDSSSCHNKRPIFHVRLRI